MHLGEGMAKRIFVVDDDVAIGNLLEELLGGAGYEVRRAYSGTEALMRVMVEAKTEQTARETAQRLADLIPQL